MAPGASGPLSPSQQTQHLHKRRTSSNINQYMRPGGNPQQPGPSSNAMFLAQNDKNGLNFPKIPNQNVV